MSTVLVTGANRGLGLEFCKQYAAQGWKVIACCRHPEQASELNSVARQFPIQIEALNVADFTQIDALSNQLSNDAIDVLINNAGVYADRGNGFGQLDYPAWFDSLTINTLAPVKIAEAFLPQIKQGNKKLIVSISSLMGSMTDNGSGGSILYRSSKAALNAAMKSLSIDLRRQAIGVLILHPGWVQTDMGGANALIDAKTSVRGMCAVIDGFHLNRTGCFLKYDGTVLPW